jgi:hypothetical protein
MLPFQVQRVFLFKLPNTNLVVIDMWFKTCLVHIVTQQSLVHIVTQQSLVHIVTQQSLVHIIAQQS